MRSKLFTILIFSLVFANTNCQTKRFTPLDYSNNLIIFGSGGGFAGTVTEYCILENGQCFLKKAGESEFNSIDDLDKNAVEQIFNNYTMLSLGEIKMKAPGNMYYFIKYGTKDKMYELVWGAYGEEPPANLKTYYNILNNLVNNQPTR